MSHSLIIWSAAIATLAIYSVLYRENPFFRFFEHVFVGVAAGYGLYQIWTSVLDPLWWQPMAGAGPGPGKWWLIWALVLGGMFYFIYSRRLNWISRLAIGLFMGVGAGAAFKGFVTQYAPQISASLKPFFLPGQGLRGIEFNHLIFFITLITVMSYFFFSVEHRGKALTGSARLGRWLLMIAFGGIFGNTVMGRLSLFLDRVMFLFSQWIHWIPKQF